MINIKKEIRTLKFESDSMLKNSILTHLLRKGDSTVVEDYINNVINGKVDLVTEFVDYSNSEKFFKTHYKEALKEIKKFLSRK